MANMAQALRLALHYGEENLGVTDIFGQDVGAPLGGVFTATQGLRTAWNSPLDERGIVGAAMGLAMAGSRCVAEIQFCDYIFNTIDLLKMAGNTLWSTNGQVSLPLVLMTPVGAGIHGSLYHSHSFDALATRLPGWKIVMPSTPLEAYGLMISAIKDPNPVLYLVPKALMRVRGEELIPGEPEQEKELRAMIDAPIGDRSQWKPRWPKIREYTLPIGKAQCLTQGEDLTIVTYGRMVNLCRSILKDYSEDSIELINLYSLYPYDWQMVKRSVQKTGRVLFLNEDSEVTNFGEHLAYRTTRELFYSLKASPRVLAGKNVPGIGLHPHLEDSTIPQESDLRQAMDELIHEVP